MIKKRLGNVGKTEVMKFVDKRDIVNISIDNELGTDKFVITLFLSNDVSIGLGRMYWCEVIEALSDIQS